MSIFENVRRGQSYDVNDPVYAKEVHTEIDRCHHVNYLSNHTDLSEKEKIHQLEEELLPPGIFERFLLYTSFPDRLRVPPLCGEESLCQPWPSRHVPGNHHH